MVNLKFTLFFILCAGAELSSAVEIRTKLSKNPAAVNEKFDFIIEAAADEPVDITPPELPKTLAPLVLSGSHSSSQVFQSFSMPGGMSKEFKTSFYYSLHCSQEGEFTIDPVSVAVDGKIYKTKEVKVQISSKVQPSPKALFRGPLDVFDFFQSPSFPPKTPALKGALQLKAFVEKKKVFLGEMLSLKWFLYKKRDMRLPVSIEEFQTVQPKDFWMEKQNKTPQTLSFNQTENLKGEDYLKALLDSYVLFPLKTGRLVIPALKIKLRMQGFGSFFSRTRLEELESQAIEIQVSSLPELGREGFTGAVGSFLIQSELEDRDILKSDLLSYKIHFTGRGGVQSIKQPAWPPDSDFEVYNVLESQNFSFEKSFKTFEFLLLPKKTGNLKTPVLNLAVFDPHLKSYVSHEIPSYSVQVRGKNTPALESSEKFFTQKEQESSAAEAPLPPAASIEEKSFYQKYVHAIWVFLYLAVLAALGWRHRRYFYKKRKIDLGRMLLNACTRAMDMKNQGRYKEAGGILLKMMDSIWMTLTGTRGRSVQVLLEKCPPSVRVELGQNIQNLIHKLEFLSFAPDSAYQWSEKEAEQVIQECEMLIQRVLKYYRQSQR